MLSEGFHPLPVMSNNEPPDHGRIRVHTTKGFSNRRMAMLEPFIRANAERLVGEMLAGERPAEFVHALAFPLPAYTVFRHIGFPDEDAEQLKRWCGNRKLFQWGRATEAEQVAIAENMVAYWHYCQEFTDAKLHDLGRRLRQRPAPRPPRRSGPAHAGRGEERRLRAVVRRATRR